MLSAFNMLVTVVIYWDQMILNEPVILNPILTWVYLYRIVQWSKG